MHTNDSGHKGRADLPHGAFSRIARRLRPKVTPQHVREVYLGNRKSDRVARAIDNYVRALHAARPTAEDDTEADRARAA